MEKSSGLVCELTYLYVAQVEQRNGPLLGKKEGTL